MKPRPLFKTFGALAAVAVLSTSATQAGPGKAPAPLPPADMAVENLLDPIETTLSTGFDSDYIYRGANWGKEAIWTGLDMSLPLGLPVGNYVANWGFWYINPTDSPRGVPFGTRGALDDELNIYASLGTTVGAFDISFGWTHYSYLDSSNGSAVGAFPALDVGDRDEIGINIGTTVETPWLPLALGFAYYYDFDVGDTNYLQNLGGGAAGPFSGSVGFPTPGDGAFDDLEHYWEGSIATSFELTDRIGFDLSAVAGWYSSYFHGLTYTAAFPIQIAENVIFEPYVSYLHEESSDNFKDTLFLRTSDQFFGGVSLSVSF